MTYTRNQYVFINFGGPLGSAYTGCESQQRSAPGDNKIWVKSDMNIYISQTEMHHWTAILLYKLFSARMAQYSPRGTFSALLAGPLGRAPPNCKVQCPGQTSLRPCEKFQPNPFSSFSSRDASQTHTADRQADRHTEDSKPNNIPPLPCYYCDPNGSWLWLNTISTWRLNVFRQQHSVSLHAKAAS